MNFSFLFFVPFSPLCVYVRVFFFYCNHAAYTVKRGHDREVGARGPRGLFKRIRFHERAFFLPLSLFLSLSLGWFFFFLPPFSSFSPFVSLTSFSPSSYFRLPIFFFVAFSPPCSFVSFFRTIARFRCYWREWMDIGETVVCERFLYWRDTVSCYGATAWLG